MNVISTALATAREDTHAFALANCLRGLAIDGVEAANSGHPGAPMGMAEAATALWMRHLKFDASSPDWPDRDRFVLSNGHGSMLLYALLHLSGYQDMPLEQLKNFRQWGAKTAGHPEYGHAKGIEVTTGPLGQGLASAVGMALAERKLNAEFGDDLVDHRTWVFAGDGCLMEGISQEAISLAGHLRLDRLTVLYDDNGISIDGPTSKAFTEDVTGRFEAAGWAVLSCDGHSVAQVDAAIAQAKGIDRPVLIRMRTVIGLGAPHKAGTAGVHGSPLGDAERAMAREALGLGPQDFSIPDDLLAEWRAAGIRAQADRIAWEGRLAASDKGGEFTRRMAGDLPAGFDAAVAAARQALFEAPQNVATRKASQLALAPLTAACPEMIGGSADLTGSNLTRVPAVDSDFQPGAYGGRYVSYGVREFGMAAAMNGIACHGGLIPYGGTFLVFSDYARNAIRLSALMGVGVVYVMTHDSIGLGEDGPTHQPVEHLAALRAMPNLNVMRPADAVEALECWEIALRARKTPSLLALSRQAVPQLRGAGEENLSAKGAYVIRDTDAPRDATILATGTEVAIAVDAAEALKAQGIHAAVVSMPCWELFEAQPAAYRAAVLGTAPRVAIEAAGTFGWTRYVATEEDVLGLRGFGASAPAERLYAEFGITAAGLIARVKHHLA
ncbi:transketolase [Pseudooceanicola sp. CBS1P-1]|uniref:Transketolase n=1 Tax=Pseudooceanicola albus TaxID=2692189 RepID=A0A6L7G593_9RHOB|nr:MULTISPECIES: transketolase [Pseudooceanicola]MBT9385039.1 transketolase [Pseudooceanicola endophyticus]MXN18668.1 transketolase [Pseudooceanicola albus]